MRARSFEAGETQGLKPGGASHLTLDNYAFLQRYIYDESGIVIDADKQYLLESRLLPIMREHEIESLNDLAKLLRTSPSVQLGGLVVEAMTTNETLFFRDPVLFESLRDEVLPQMFAVLRGARKLRIWSAAASTGQEAYSMAMLLLEMGKGKDDVEIVATDLSRAVLERAREGRYNQFEINRGLSATHLKKHFIKTGTEWQLASTVREMVRFEQLDLRRNCRFLGNFDIILCRNVLIYFDNETKKQILTTIREALTPEGLLVLGCAETIINIHSGFQRRLIEQSSFYTR